jgi:hypothetical protein
MKRLESLKGVITLNRNQQKSIFGGVSDHDALAESGTGGGGGSGGHYCMSYDSCSTGCAERFWDHPANPGGYYWDCTNCCWA